MESTLNSYKPNKAMRCIQVALLCVQKDSNDRPDMSAIVFMLSGEASPPIPKQPAYVFRKYSGADDVLLSNDMTVTIMEAR